MSPPLDQLIDHAADLQRQLDRLWAEVLCCYLMILALAIIVGVLTMHAWKPGP